MFTGRFIFPYLNWGPLPKDEVLLSDTLAKAGYTCAIATDNLPMGRSDYHYTRGFHSVMRVRGQWYDNFKPLEGPLTWPCEPSKLGDGPDQRVKQYLRNVADRKTEDDYFAPRVVIEAMNWLERHHDESPFYLHVDIFDPHEPWDPPVEMRRLYDPDGSGDDVIRPVMGPADAYSDADMERIRALYWGEITLMDRWVGKLLDRLEELGRAHDTIVCFLSDHGVFLGDRGLLGKLGKSEQNVKGWPTYCELSRVPMMWRVPGVKPGRTESFMHPGDVAPTLLDLTGVKRPDRMKARSAVPVLERQETAIRDIAVSSWSLRGVSAHRPSVIRTEEWTLVEWRTGIKPELYHRKSDPLERINVFDSNRAAAAELHRRYIQFLRENDAPTGNVLPRQFQIHWGRSESISREA